MNINAITLIGVRLLALYLIVESIAQLGAQSTFIYFSEAGLSSFEIAALLHLGVPVIVGVIMLIKAESISNWIGKENEPQELEFSDNYLRLQKSALCLIGIIVFLFCIPNLILYGYMSFIAEPLEYDGIKLGNDPSAPGKLIAALVQMGIGYFLTFRTSQIVALINRHDQP